MPRKQIKTGTAAPAAKENGVVLHNFPGYFLLACIGVTLYFLLKVYSPFVTVLIFAAILATAVYPLYKWVLKLFKGRAKGASLVTCFLVLVFILVPLFVFIFLLGRQAFDAYRYIQESIMNGALDPYLKWQKGGLIYDGLGFLRDHGGNVIDFESFNLRESITTTAQGVTTFLATQSANLLKGIGWLFINLFIMLFALYYFFKDGTFIMRKISTLSPLPNRHEEELFRKFNEISHAALYGIFLTAVAQGIIGGIGFAIVGIPSPLFWGTAIALFSLVPIIGTATIWLPASVVLVLIGNVWEGTFLFFYGLLIVSTVDNFLRAYLIGEKAKMNQLLTFLSVFGGIWAFGLVGVIIGPLILTLFFAFLHIYEKEYDNVLHHRK